MHYVCSDFHGQYELYIELLNKINFQKEDTLYILGDVIDRGPDGISILEDIMERENVVFFLGNHELLMLDHIQKNMDYSVWFHPQNGGEITWNQFQKLSPTKQNDVLSYIQNAWIQKYIEVDGIAYALHHSYFIPEMRGKDVKYSPSLNYNAIFDAVWNSPYRFWEYAPEGEYDDGYVHITGHIPVQNFKLEKPPHYNKYLKEKLINIDGGCAMLFFGEKGGLFCMSLEKDEEGKRKEFWIEGKPCKVL